MELRKSWKQAGKKRVRNRLRSASPLEQVSTERKAPTGLREPRDWELPRDLELQSEEDASVLEVESIEEAHEAIQKLLEDRKLTVAAEVWRKIDYEVAGNKDAGIQGLRTVCKVRDRQIANLSQQIKNVDILKGCIQLKNSEILELMTNYEEMKSKYLMAHKIKGRELHKSIHCLEARVKELEHELEKRELSLRDKIHEAALLQKNLKAYEEQPKIDLKTLTLLKAKEERIHELEQLLHAKPVEGSDQHDVTDSQVHVPYHHDVQKTQDSIEKEWANAKGPKQRRAELDTTHDGKLMPITTRTGATVDALALENSRNRILLKELLKQKDGKDYTTANIHQLLFEEKTELADRVLVLTEELEGVCCHSFVCLPV